MFNKPQQQIEKPYGLWLYAASQRKFATIGSQWLRTTIEGVDEVDVRKLGEYHSDTKSVPNGKISMQESGKWGYKIN